MRRYTINEKKQNHILQQAVDLEAIEQEIKDMHMDEDSKYFEIRIQTLSAKTRKGDQEIILVIKDVTNIIRNQQKISDKIYQESIEANYSHEQMTPLNCILTNSKIIRQRIKALIDTVEVATGDKESVESKTHNQTLNLLNAIEFSGQIMQLYNRN